MVKLYCIAALVALPLLAGAAPATDITAQQEAAVPTATALPLAIDYLTREMDARLRRGTKGKPPRPDLPSNASYSPAHKDALRTVFGTEQPLVVKRLPGKGTANYSLAIPAHHFEDADNRYTWQAVSGKLSIDGKGQVSTVANWPGIALTGTEGTFQLQGMHMNSVRQRDLLTGTSRVTLDHLSFSAANGMDAVLRNLKAGGAITRAGKRLEAQMDMGVQELRAGGETVNDLHIAMRWRHLDESTLVAIRAIADALRDNGSADVNVNAVKAMATIGDIRHLFQKLVLRGATMDIDDISAVYRGNKAKLQLSLAMPGAVAADFDSAERVVQKLAVRMHVSIPLPLLRDVATMAAERSNRGKDKPDMPTAQLASQIYEFMLGKVVGGNFATVEKNTLVSTIELKGGNLFVNAQAIPIEPLLALLKEPDGNLPPPDTSKPVAVDMEDRGLEAARLFALNGDYEGLYEMCERYFEGRGVPKDHVEALKWCIKGSDSGSSRVRTLLAKLYREGDAPVRDAAAALKLEQTGEDEETEQDEIEKPDPWTIITDVSSGYYLKETYRFDATRHRRIQLTFGPFKENEKWAPMQSICLSAEKPSDNACLSLIRVADQKDKFVVVSEVRSTDGATSRGKTVMPTLFTEGDSLDVRVYTKGGKAYFLVNNEKPLTQSIVFPVELMKVSCSTGKCAFQFEQPPAAPGGVTANAAH